MHHRTCIPLGAEARSDTIHLLFGRFEACLSIHHAIYLDRPGPFPRIYCGRIGPIPKFAAVGGHLGTLRSSVEPVAQRITPILRAAPANRSSVIEIYRPPGRGSQHTNVQPSSSLCQASRSMDALLPDIKSSSGQISQLCSVLRIEALYRSSGHIDISSHHDDRQCA